MPAKPRASLSPGDCAAVSRGPANTSTASAMPKIINHVFVFIVVPCLTCSNQIYSTQYKMSCNNRWMISFVSLVNVNRPHMRNDKRSGWGGQGGGQTAESQENPVGGGEGIRTPDLLVANEALYQLSYTPNRGQGLLVTDGLIANNFLLVPRPPAWGGGTRPGIASFSAASRRRPRGNRVIPYQRQRSTISRSSDRLSRIGLPFMLLAAAAFSTSVGK